MSLGTFYPFSQLSIELSPKIWNTVPETPRVLSLHIVPGFTSANSGDCMGSQHMYMQRNRVPTILHVCRESRLLRLEKYEVGFEVRQVETEVPEEELDGDRESLQGSDGDGQDEYRSEDGVDSKDEDEEEDDEEDENEDEELDKEDQKDQDT
jgi:hypothetical protein